jgi:hypothetical protein
VEDRQVFFFFFFFFFSAAAAGQRSLPATIPRRHPKRFRGAIRN